MTAPPRVYGLIALASLVALACGPRAAEVRTAGVPAPTTRQAAPDKASLPLAELKPDIPKPADVPGADDIPASLAGDVKRAEDFIAEGQYGKAVPVLDDVRKQLPKSPRVLRGLGIAYAGLGNRPQAQGLLTESLADAPDHLRVHLALGLLAIHDEKPEAAIRHFRTGLRCSDAVEANPDTGELYLRLGALLEQQGYYTAAADGYARLAELVGAHGMAYSKRPSLNPVVTQPERLTLAQGRVLFRAGAAERAARLLDRAYRGDKTNREAGQLAVEALVAAKDYDRAEAIIREMLDEPSQLAQAVNSAMDLCVARGDPELAQRFLQSYLDRGGSDNRFVIAMADVMARLGAPAAAAKVLAKQAASAPEDNHLRMRLAQLRARAGEMNVAAVQFAALLGDEDVPFEEVRKALHAVARRDMKPEAIDRLAESAAKADPKQAPGLLTVTAVLVEGTGDKERARKLLDEAIKGDVKFNPAYEALERLYADAADKDALAKLAQQANATDSHFRAYIAGKVSLDLGEIDKAIGSLEEARAGKGGHVPTLIALGRAYLRAGRGVDAERRLLAAFALGPHVETAARELFDMYAGAGKLTEAGRVAVRFLQDNPSSVPGQLLLGRYYQLTKQTDKMREALRELLARAGDDPDVLLLDLHVSLPESLAGDAIPARQAEEAIAKADRILKLDPANLDARRIKALLLDNQKRYAESADQWRQLHRADPDSIALLALYLDALVKADRKAELVEAVDQAAGRKDLDFRVRGILLGKLLAAKELDKADALSAKWLAAIEDPEQRDVLRMQMIYLLLDAQQTDRALAVAETRLAEAEKLPAGDPRDLAIQSARRNVIVVLLSAKRKDEALARARSYVQAAPASPDALRLLASVLSASDMEKEYLDTLEKVFEVDPDDPGVNNDLGYSWADRGINLAKAEFMIRKALAARPDEIAFKDSLAWALYKQGKFAEAQRLFEQVIDAPADELHPVILDHAGDACWRLGQKDQAVALWKRAIEMAKQDKDPDRESKRVLADASEKIAAADKGGAPKVAPLGKDVDLPTTQPK